MQVYQVAQIVAWHYITVELRAESDVCLCVNDIVLVQSTAQHNAVAVREYRHFH